MDLGLEGKTVLVTGSTAGIGFAAARLFAREGATVYVNGRSAQRVDAAVTALGGGDVHGITGDVSTAEGVGAIIDALPEVDVLVNNAGIFEPKAFEDIPDADWMRFFETNVMSGIRLSRHYMRGMLARDWGRIVFVSSESAVQIPVEMIHYGMTKTAQLAVARGLAERTRGTGVTVNSVLPGHARPSSLIGRLATPDEIANLIVYTASQAASATTGASLRVDGGVVRSIV